MAGSQSLPAIGGVGLKVGTGSTSYNRRPARRSELKHRDPVKERLLASKLKDIKFAEKLGKAVQLRLFKKVGRNRKLWPIVAERVKAETETWMKAQHRQVSFERKRDTQARDANVDTNSQDKAKLTALLLGFTILFLSLLCSLRCAAVPFSPRASNRAARSLSSTRAYERYPRPRCEARGS